MADLKTKIVISAEDRSKEATSSAVKNVKKLSKSTNDVSKSSKRAADSVDDLADQLSRTAKSSKQAKDGQDKLNDELGKTEKASKSLGNELKNASKNLLGFFSISKGIDLAKNIIKTADSYTLIQSRIKLATEGVKDYISANTSLFVIAQQTRSEFGDVAELFVRTNEAIKNLGKTQKDTLDFVGLIGKANKISGASASESSNSIRQLTQALQSGVLRGDEFNSVMENSPRISKALAAGLDVPIAALREMAAQGELTSDKVINAILSQKDIIGKEFGEIPATVSDALVKIKNIWEKGIGELNTDADFSGEIVAELDRLSISFTDFLSSLKNNVAEIKGTLSSIIGSARFLGNGFIVVFNGIQIVMRGFVRAMFGFAADINDALAAITFGDSSKEFKANADAMRSVMLDLEKDISNDANSASNAIGRMGASFDTPTEGAKNLGKATKELVVEVDKTTKAIDGSTAALNVLTKAQEKILDSSAKSIYEETRTDLEKLNKKQDKYKKLLDAGKISQDTFNRAMEKTNKLIKQQKTPVVANNTLSNNFSNKKKGSALSDLRKQAEIREQNWQAEKQQILEKQRLLDSKNPFKKPEIKLPTQEELNNKLRQEAEELLISLGVDIDSGKVIESVNAARNEAQSQVKPIVIPVIFEDKAGNSFSDKSLKSAPVLGDLQREVIKRGRLR